MKFATPNLTSKTAPRQIVRGKLQAAVLTVASISLRKAFALAVANLLLLWFGASIVAQEDVINREYPLKALFLYNFGSYVEWPVGTFANPQTPFVIGVFGSAPLDETLNQIAASKQVGQRRIVIEHYKLVSEVRNCQILFVPRTVPQSQQKQIIDAMKNRPVLLVGESDNFAVNGGDINFFIQANNIRFEINVTAVKAQQLKINSKLLAMAKLVGEGAPAQR